MFSGVFSRQVRRMGNKLTSGFCDKVQNVKRFLYVQLSGPPLSVHASVVVHPIGQIRVFLHFANDHAWPDSVRRAGRNKKRVTCLNRVTLKQILQRVILKCIQERFFCDARFEANKQGRTRLGGNDVPHLRFSPPTRSFFVN